MRKFLPMNSMSLIDIELFHFSFCVSLGISSKIPNCLDLDFSCYSVSLFSCLSGLWADSRPLSALSLVARALSLNPSRQGGAWGAGIPRALAGLQGVVLRSVGPGDFQ